MTHRTLIVSALRILIACIIVLPSAVYLQADEPETPKAIPANRQEMLEALDRLKHRQPRLPMPPVDAAPSLAVPQLQHRRQALGYRAWAWSTMVGCERSTCQRNCSSRALARDKANNPPATCRTHYD